MLKWVFAPDTWTLKSDSVDLRNILCWRSVAPQTHISRSGERREIYQYCDHKGYNTVQSGMVLLIFSKK